MRRLNGIAAAVVAAGLCAWAGPSPLPAPLPGPLQLTSSFGEYRAGHYHAGLDFSTGGREGVPVLAPGPGSVWRVRVSGIGYGRSLYYRLEDGRTVLFAHLSRFHPRIDKTVAAVQDRDARYEVDLRPKAQELSFALGDTLGFTGQSGAGPPHLHAEVREGDEASVAMNPWHLGWAPADSIAPVLSRLRVEPARPGVLVNGSVGTTMLSLESQPTPSTLRITGPVRLWVLVSDAAASGSRIAPYHVEALLDGESIGDVRFDQVDWNWAREVTWTFDAARARTKNERWIALQPPPGGRLRLARGDPGWGERLDPGRYPLEIMAEDASGNRTRSRLTVSRETLDPQRPLSGAPIRPAFTSRGGYLEISLVGDAARLPLWAQSPQDDTTAVDAVTWSTSSGVLHQIAEPRPASPGLWRFYAGDSLLGQAIWIPGAGGGPSWSGFLPWKRNATRVSARVEQWRLDFFEDASYGPLWIALRQDKRGSTSADVERVSPRLELLPWSEPLRRDLGVTWMLVGEDRRGLALGRWEDGEWEFVGADSTEGGVSATSPLVETLAVIRDRMAPRVTLEPVGSGRRPRLRAAVEDAGVGVSWSGLTLRLDGRAVVAEWDPDAGRLIAHLRGPLDPGLHSWEVEAIDRVGNRARQSATFRVQ